MQTEERFIIVTYTGVTLSRTDTVGLRGFFADQDRSADHVHNHQIDGSVIYRYPQVQYKVIQGHPTIVAFGSGISEIYPIVMENDELHIYDRTYKDPEMHIDLKKKPIGDSKLPCRYKLLSPWIALNQENYKKYQLLTGEEDKAAFLNRILIGNILSLCKGFGVTIENKLTVESHLKPISIRYKRESMIGFTGEFTVNAKLPSLCGIGKGVALGYGTFIKIAAKEGEF